MVSDFQVKDGQVPMSWICALAGSLAGISQQACVGLLKGFVPA